MAQARNALARVADAATIALALCAVGFLGVRGWSSMHGGNRPPTADRKVKDWESYGRAGNRIGPPNATVTLVEFGDYECPFCRRFEPVIESVLDAFPDDVALVQRHFPLTQHQYAYQAARLAQCGAAQGVFEDAHRYLYSVPDLSAVTPEAMAAALSLPDEGAFMECGNERGTVRQIERDRQAADRLGLNGTPTILVNDLLLASTPDSAKLFGLVTRALKKKR
jgi:protein-disulfide isomerase